jgi:hypothetical protein
MDIVAVKYTAYDFIKDNLKGSLPSAAQSKENESLTTLIMNNNQINN